MQSVYPVQKKVQKFFTLTYIAKASDIIRKHFIKSFYFKDINVSFRTCNKLDIHIKNNKSKTVKQKSQDCTNNSARRSLTNFK